MRTITTLLLSLLHFTSYSQIANNTQRHNDKNIYYQALKRYVQFTSNDRPAKSQDTLFVYADNKTTDSLLDYIGSTRIIMLDDPNAYINKHNHQPITLFSIFPLRYSRGKFSVPFVPFSAKESTLFGKWRKL